MSRPPAPAPAHSPLPWTACTCGKCAQITWRDGYVAECHLPEASYGPVNDLITSMANMLLIVRCVNHHEALVAALLDIADKAKAIDNLSRTDETPGAFEEFGRRFDALGNSWRNAEAVLARVEGSPNT